MIARLINGAENDEDGYCRGLDQAIASEKSTGKAVMVLVVGLLLRSERYL